MSTVERKMVSVYKSSRKAETYLYVDKRKGTEDVPGALLEHFGKPQHVIDLLLTPEKKLARTTGKDILEAIRDKGFYLQLPPPPEEEARRVIEAAERYSAFSRAARDDAS
ncbi:YcgL domain-containing protein [Hahella sp. SMD15-11]|uniref:YcgL domain-containing protein AAIA72_03850 n=1 Tax=Thermohahella caldifontis TaxID=3142973 RepID=A0AB39UYG5_9GAMM